MLGVIQKALAFLLYVFKKDAISIFNVKSTPNIETTKNRDKNFSYKPKTK